MEGNFFFATTPLMMMMCVCVWSDEDGNINPYATFPFSGPARSPPARPASHAVARDPQHRSVIPASHAPPDSDATQHTRLGTVRLFTLSVAFNSRVTINR